MAKTNSTSPRRKAAQPRHKGPSSCDLFTASVRLQQARGIVETVIELKPTAGQLDSGEIAQALYGAVDQITQAFELIDGEVDETVVP